MVRALWGYWLGWRLPTVGMVVPVEDRLDVGSDVPFMKTWQLEVEVVVRMLPWEGFWGRVAGWGLLFPVSVVLSCHLVSAF